MPHALPPLQEWLLLSNGGTLLAFFPLLEASKSLLAVLCIIALLLGAACVKMPVAAVIPPQEV